MTYGGLVIIEKLANILEVDPAEFFRRASQGRGPNRSEWLCRFYREKTVPFEGWSFRPFQTPRITRADRLGHVIAGSFILQAALQKHGGGSMDIDRRGLLKASCLALTGLATPFWAGSTAEAGSTPFQSRFHPDKTTV